MSTAGAPLSYSQPLASRELQNFSPEMIKPALSLGGEERTAHVECVNCNQALPLRLARREETPAKWRCRLCGVPYAAVCVREQMQSKSSLVKLDESYFDMSRCEEVLAEVREAVAILANRNPPPVAEDRRRSRRVSQSLEVPAVCVDRNFSPEGASFRLMVANISREGIGLVHSDPIATEEIALELSPGRQDPIQVIVHIVREQPLEDMGYEIGGEFVVRLGGFGG